MSLFSDILAALKKQATRNTEADTPERSQTELATDLAAAIEGADGVGGIYGGSGNVPTGTVANLAGNSLSFGLALNTGMVKITDETGAVTDLEVSRQSSAVKFDSPNKTIALEGTTAVTVTATDNSAKTQTWEFSQEGWEKHPQLSANPTNPTGTGQEYYNTAAQRVKRYSGSDWKNKEPVYLNLQETDRGAVVAAGIGKKFLVIPAEFAGMKITSWTARTPSGTGDLFVGISKNGGAGTNLISLTDNTATSTGASVLLSAGDTLSVDVTINTTGLQGLAVVFKIE